MTRRRQDPDTADQLVTFDAEYSNQEAPQINETGPLTRKLRKSVQGGAMVRRLTPTECERLQGWPDGWTLTEPSDEPNPKPDGPRYSAAGDGVTAHVSEWIGSRMLAVAQRERA